MITIVIPIYNREKYLLRTLESIAQSTFRPINLIMVDNGSTDGSMEIAQRFQREHMSDDFSIYFTEESQRGANFARNKGLSRVRSKYVYFFDNDDMFDKDFLWTFEHLLTNTITQQKVPDMVCLLTNMHICSQNKTVVRDYHFRNTDPVCNQIIAGTLCTPAMIFRTEWLRNIGGWNERLQVWQDWELGVRALLNRPRLMWYRERAFHTTFVHKNSITGRTNKAQRQASIDAVRQQLTNSRQRWALRIRELNNKIHIPLIWKLAKFFK